MKKLILSIALCSFWCLDGVTQSVTIKPGTFQYSSVIGGQFSFGSNSIVTGASAYFEAGTAGTSIAIATIPLPNGAKIVEMTAMFIDNTSTQNMTIRLLQQSFTSGSIIETMTLNPPTSSNAQAVTIPVSPAFTINASNQIIFVRVGLTDTAVTWPGSALSILGVIIKYTLE